MAVPQLGYIGERKDLLIRQGATLGPFQFVLQNTDGTPVDLTGASIVGQIRRKPSDSAVAADLEVAISDAVAGRYEIGLSAGVTAGLQCGADAQHPSSLYHWDLELHDSLARVIPLHWGEVRVHREVTRG